MTTSHGMRPSMVSLASFSLVRRRISLGLRPSASLTRSTFAGKPGILALEGNPKSIDEFMVCLKVSRTPSLDVALT